MNNTKSLAYHIRYKDIYEVVVVGTMSPLRQAHDGLWPKLLQEVHKKLYELLREDKLPIDFVTKSLQTLKSPIRSRSSYKPPTTLDAIQAILNKHGVTNKRKSSKQNKAVIEALGVETFLGWLSKNVKNDETRRMMRKRYAIKVITGEVAMPPLTCFITESRTAYRHGACMKLRKVEEEIVTRWIRSLMTRKKITL